MCILHLKRFLQKRYRRFGFITRISDRSFSSPPRFYNFQPPISISHLNLTPSARKLGVLSHKKVLRSKTPVDSFFVLSQRKHPFNRVIPGPGIGLFWFATKKMYLFCVGDQNVIWRKKLLTWMKTDFHTMENVWLPDPTETSVFFFGKNLNVF